MRSLSRRVAMLLLASTVLAVPGAALAEKVTLNFLTAEKDETVAPAIEGFEKLYPDIDVVHTTVPFDSMNATVEARVGGQDSSIDVFLVDSPRVPAMANRGYLLNLNEFREAADKVSNDVAMGVVSYKDDMYALPLWTSTQLMYYNKDLLDKAGIPYPGAGEADRLTYDQVVDLAKKAQAAGAKYGFLPEQIDRYYQLQPLFESIGGGSGLTGPDNLTPDITNPKWIEAAEFYSSLFKDGVSPRGIPTDQMSSVFTSGDVAFYIGGPWQFRPFNATEGLRYGVAPVPYFQGGKPVVPTDSWAVGISPHAAHPDEAKKFVEYLSINPEGALLSVANNPIPPTNEVAYTTYIDGIAALDPEVGPAAKEIMTYELAKNSVSRPRSIGYVAFEEIMNRAFSDIRNGADVTTTLQQAQDQLNSTLARIQ